MIRTLQKILVVALALLCVVSCNSCSETEPTAANDIAEPPVVTPTPTPDEGVDTSTLILVNRWNAIPEDYEVHQVAVGNNQTVDASCYDALMRMLDDCDAAGLEPLVCSGYRDIDLQTQLYENKIARLVSSGFSRKDAEETAGTEVAYPGTSEHHTGLAVDIVDVSYQVLDKAQEQTAVQRWLMENSWKYGFILRYPSGKSDVTGIIYEPWHYRYVGTTAAQTIYEQGLCLEEYLNLYG